MKKLAIFLSLLLLIGCGSKNVATVSGVDISKDDPDYVSYYRQVRAHVYDSLRGNLPEVYEDSSIKVILELVKNGRLVSLKVNSNTDDERLRLMIYMGIKKSVPFPEFPQVLTKYDRLKYTIKIEVLNSPD